MFSDQVVQIAGTYYAAVPKIMIKDSGEDILDMIQPERREIVRERIRQASEGAQGEVSDVHLIRQDGRDVRLDMVLREVCWDGSLGVLILSRISR